MHLFQLLLFKTAKLLKLINATCLTFRLANFNQVTRLNGFYHSPISIAEKGVAAVVQRALFFKCKYKLVSPWKPLFK